MEINRFGRQEGLEGRGVRGEGIWEQHGQATNRKRIFRSKTCNGQITDDGRRKNDKCMNWH